MKFIYVIYTMIISVLIFILSFIFVVLFWWLLFFPKEKRFTIFKYLVMYPWTFIVNKLLLLMRVKVIGKENIKKEKVKLIISNHQSWIDIPALLRYNRSTAISKKEVTKIPLLGILILYAGTILFDRDDTKQRLHLIKQIMFRLKAGYSLMVFPEGTRTVTGKLLEPNLALLKLCYKLKVAVIPSAIEGTRFILPKGRKYLKFGQKVVIKYNEPVYPKDFKRDVEFANYCWNKVVDSYNEIQENYFNKKK